MVSPDLGKTGDIFQWPFILLFKVHGGSIQIERSNGSPEFSMLFKTLLAVHLKSFIEDASFLKAKSLRRKELASDWFLRRHKHSKYELQWLRLHLTHWGLVTPFGEIDLGQLWLRKWLVALRHQAITWTNVDLSPVRSNRHEIWVRLRRRIKTYTVWSLENITWIRQISPGINNDVQTLFIKSTPTTFRPPLHNGFMQKVNIFCTLNDHLYAFYASPKTVQIGWGHHVKFCVWKKNGHYFWWRMYITCITNMPLLDCKVSDDQLLTQF